MGSRCWGCGEKFGRCYEHAGNCPDDCTFGRHECPATWGWDDNPVVCVSHGRFIPCRSQGEHDYTDNPFWIKSVRDYQSSDVPGLTWEPVKS